jgi:hypothetical protein
MTRAPATGIPAATMGYGFRTRAGRYRTRGRDRATTTKESQR